MKRRNLILASLIFGIVLLVTGTVAYFVRSVNGNITGQTGNLVFNVNGLTGETTQTLSFSLNRSEEEPYVYPDDKGYFDLEISAEGSTTDVYVTLEVIREHLPDNLKFYADENYNAVINTRYFFFEKTGEMSTTKRIYWFWDGSKDDYNDSLYINEALSAKLRVSATPMEYGMMKNGNIDKESLTEFWQPQYYSMTRSINFTKDFSGMPSECTEENLCFDISYEENQKYPVYAYLVETGETGMGYDEEWNEITGNLYDLSIVCEKTVFAPINSQYLFAGFSNLKNINFNDWFNTSKVGSMSGMFENCYNLTEIDASIFNTNEVLTFNTMFDGCLNLTSLDLSNFDTRNVTDMQRMFYGFEALTSLDLSSFDTSNVSGMMFMFYYCTNLVSLDVSNFDMKNVESMWGMFDSCENLTELDLSGFDTSNVDDMDDMFCNAKKINTELTITSPDILNYSRMLMNAATDENAKIVLNYTSETSDLVDDMLSTASTASNVVKGKMVSTPSTYTLTINDTTVDYLVNNNSLHEGTRVRLRPNEYNKYISSFKLNGETVYGDSFNLTSDSVITDVVMYNINITSEFGTAYAQSVYNISKNYYTLIHYGYDIALFEVNDILVAEDCIYVEDGYIGDINIVIKAVKEFESEA